MKLVDEIFNKSIFNETKLLEYGFIKIESSFFYNTKIHNNKFELELSVSNGKASGKLIDLDFNDEYTQINIEGPVGSFIGNLREECEKILIDIRDKCCSVERFISSQANSIPKYIDNKYGIKIEFLWEKYPGFGIFRRKENNKWFGLISEVKRSKLDNGNNNEVINILNVKVEDGMAYSYIDNVGIYKAYHMNANNWISVLLDGSVDDEVICNLIDKSYELIKKKDSWIVPANPKYYDIVEAFNKNEEIIWKQSTDIAIGDIIYMYVASPYSSVLYKCIATEVNIPYEYKDKNVKMNYVMKIKLEKKYDSNKYTKEYLESKGIRTIRGPRKINKAIFE